MNERFLVSKQNEINLINQRDEKQLIMHSIEMEKLQYEKKENEYIFTIEQLRKKNEELQHKLNFMERHCKDAIMVLTNDNSELINLVKDKDNVMDKI